MDMHSLQVSLEAIERVCTLKKAHAQSGKKSFSEEQCRKQAAQYWSYEASFQESLFREVLQTM
jgi:hypothetical protein